MNLTNLLIVMVVATVIPTSPTTRLRSALGTVAKDPRCTSQIALVTSRLATYDQTITSARSYATTHQLTITVIGQSHWMPGLDLSAEQIVRQSQDRILAELERRKPALVAMENIEYETVRLSTIKRDLSVKALVPPRQLQLAYRFLIEMQAPLGYLERHPAVTVMAADDRALHELHALLLGLPTEGTSWNGINPIQTLEREVNQFRSELALARLIQRMSKSGLRTGVLVIGQNHLIDYPMLSRLYPQAKLEYVYTAP
jgi:hypothetical protein